MLENKIFSNGYDSRRFFRTTTMIHTYDISITVPSDREGVEPVTLDWTGKERYRAAQIIRTARLHNASSVEITHHAEFRVVWTTLCAGCLARESEWEYDCDGQYDTVNCGECDWHAAFKTRNADRDRNNVGA